MEEILQNISLKEYTTFKIGGPAKYFIKTKNAEQLKEALFWSSQNKEKVFVLGGGSNLLISDKGFDGLVIKIEDQKIAIKDNYITAGAGINLTKLITITWQHSLVGMENLYGIYGTLGGAIRGNAGAYGSEISEFIKEIEYILDNKLQKMTDLSNKFSYRDSVFKHNPEYIIVSAKLELEKGDTEFAKKKAKEIQIKRLDCQNIMPSPGCIFKNIKENQFNQFIKDNPKIELPDVFKQRKAIPAAWLIDQLGLKGFCTGHACVSKDHANFIINKGNSTADQAVQLITYIKTKVRNSSHINLTEEIQYVGF